MPRMNEKAILAALLAFIVSGCSNQDEEVVEPKARPAKLTTIEASSNQRNLTFPAIVQSTQSAELTFPLNGEIIELNAIEGSEVEAGTTIAMLDQRDAQNSLNRARAEYENAEAEYQRAAQLIDRGGISRSDLDNRRTQRDIASASLDEAEKNFSDTVLKAPFSGFISRVYVEQFQNVQSKEAIARLQSEQMEVIVNIPGSIVARSLQFEPINTSVILDAAPELAIPAEFTESSGEADPNTQTYEVRFAFESPDNLVILPGMTATLQTTLVLNGVKDLIPDGISVPLSSILAEGDKTFVWVVNEDSMTTEKRAVNVGPEVGEFVTVVEGLSGGETIVSAGVSFFHEGTLVRPWSPE